MSQSLINPELILLDVEASDREALLQYMADVLLDKGYVKDSFAEAIIAREQQFSTGLPGAGAGVAIPHTDAEHVNESVMLVSRLKEPVAFQMMGMPEEIIDTEIVFMLALKESDSHMSVLAKLMDFIQDEALVSSLLNATSQSDIHEILVKNID